MYKCGLFNPEEEEEEDSVLSKDGESLIKELLCLEHLNLISLTFRSSRALQNFFKIPNLLHITEALSIGYCESPLVNVLHLAFMEHLKELDIFRCDFERLNIDCTGEVQKVLQSGFRSLSKVSLNYCPSVKDLTWLALAPILKEIVITCCDDMEEIISFEKLSEVSEIMEELNLFAKLEFLLIVEANKLKSIYRNPLPFPRLNAIYVNGCSELKKLPLNTSSAKEHRIFIGGEQEWWEELQWEDEATENAFSTCFVQYNIV